MRTKKKRTCTASPLFDQSTADFWGFATGVTYPVFDTFFANGEGQIVIEIDGVRKQFADVFFDIDGDDDDDDDPAVRVLHGQDRFTTTGSVRGGCGHVHLTRAAAEKCLDRDHRGCVTQGGYSDRKVVTVLAVMA